MTDTLTLIGPGRLVPTTPALVLLDDREYAESLFAETAESVRAGDGVASIARNGERVFVAQEAALRETSAVHALILVTTDTDVKTVGPIARACRTASIHVYPALDDSAVASLEAEGLPYTLYRPGARLPDADVALLTADWSVQQREFVRRCRAANIPTLALQEAVNVDFDGPPHRMRWADSVAITGPQTLRYLRRDVAFLTGNPRFDAYTPAAPPSSDTVLINCNFMLGFGGERGREWLDLALEAVHEIGCDYAITRHPRDDTDLTGIENVLDSGAYRVRDQLERCCVLVSRDSSLPYEALLLNRPVIYFDPFGEKERTLREDTSGLIATCTTKEGLIGAIGSVSDAPLPYDRPTASEAFASLFTSVDGTSHLRVLAALEALARCPDRYRSADARVDQGLRASARDLVQLRLRPHLRRIRTLRVAWRAAKRRRR